MTRPDSDAGYVSFYVVAVVIGLIAMAGLVFDGGTALAAREQAADLAQQAARAGADALTPESLRGADPGGLRVDPGAAKAAADAVLSAGGVTGTVRIDGTAVTVTVEVHRRTAILSAVGITDISGTATATAVSIRGTTTQGG